MIRTGEADQRRALAAEDSLYGADEDSMVPGCVLVIPTGVPSAHTQVAMVTPVTNPLHADSNSSRSIIFSPISEAFEGAAR
jgi:hypothetical protein